MNSKWMALTLIAVAAVPLIAQKIQSESGDRNRIVHLETALNHLTIIEVCEPLTMVAAGSPSFNVEWKENKVFVQPTEPEVATNLFTWTTSERLNYELEPAGGSKRWILLSTTCRGSHSVYTTAVAKTERAERS